MPFSDSDLEKLADDFLAVADPQILSPRAWERMQGGNAGYAHFQRGMAEATTQTITRRCVRCRCSAVDGRVLCARHLEIKRRESNASNRKRGIKAWVPGSKGRPPLGTQRAAETEVAIQRAMLADAMEERRSLDKRIAFMKGTLTTALRVARNRSTLSDKDGQIRKGKA